VDQDRLVKVLRFAGISTRATANRFLEETYLPRIPGKVSRPADTPVLLGKADLAEVRFACRLFQLLKTHRHLSRPGDKGIIRIRREGILSILGKGKSLLLEELPLPKKVCSIPLPL
jgi:hypothetical protein